MIQYYEIPSVLTTVRKAVMDGVIQRVLDESGIAPRDTVFTDPQFENAHQIGATLGDPTVVSHAGSSKVYVQVQEERDDFSRINTVPGFDRQEPFFEIVSDEVRAQPIMVRYNVTITMSRNSPSSDELHRWINRLNGLLDMGRFSLMTESEAYYLIPRECIQLLAACYNAAGARKPVFASFKDYMKAGLSENATTVAAQAGEQKDLAIRFAPTRMEVVYDAIDPYPNKEETHWEAAFVIRFVYQCPETVMVSYPHIINQTPLESQYFPQTDPAWVSNEEGVSRSLIQRLEDATRYNNFARILIRLPYSVCPTEQIHATHHRDQDKELPILISDITFNEDNMTQPYVLSTEELNYEWNPYLKEYIEYCRSIDPTGKNCLFKFRVYQHGIAFEDKSMRWVGNKLYLNADIVLEKRYIVTESVRRDWRGIDLYPLQRFPKALLWLLAWLFPLYDFPPEWWELEKIPPSILEKVIDETQKPNKANLVGPVTVLNSTVFAVKEEGRYVGLTGSGAYVLGAGDIPVWINMENRRLAELLRQTMLDGFRKESL